MQNVKKIVAGLMMMTGLWLAWEGGCSAEEVTPDYKQLIRQSVPVQSVVKSYEDLLSEERFQKTPDKPTEVFLMESGYQDIPQVMIEVTSVDKINREEYIPAQVTIVDPSGENRILKDIDAQVRIRGNFTSKRDKKPYNIKLSGKAELLGMSAGKKWYLLANRYDKSLVRNRLVLDLAAQMRMDYTPESRYVDLWLNGTYLGNYLITTPIDVKKNLVDIDVEEGDFLFERERSRVEEGVTYIKSPIYGYRLAFNEPENPTEEQFAAAEKILRGVDEAIASRDLEEVKKVLDIDSFIDLHLVNEFFKNQDADFSSTRFYVKDGRMYAGPLWDADLSMGNVNPWLYTQDVNDPDVLYVLQSGWIKELMEIDEFARLFATRYVELQDVLVNIYEDNELGTNQMDLLLEQYGEAFLRDSQVAGWGFVSCGLDKTPKPTYRENVEEIREWLKIRNEWLLAYMKGLLGEAE